MKIISSGTHKVSDGSVIFTCPHCGCKFSASPDEYYQDTSWYNGNLYTTYTFTNTYSIRYHANCPECYKITVTCNQQGCDSCD